jgi:hypothetical protein
MRRNIHGLECVVGPKETIASPCNAGVSGSLRIVRAFMTPFNPIQPSEVFKVDSVGTNDLIRTRL